MTRTFKLNSGYTIPALGLGTYKGAPGVLEDAVSYALKVGYRHFDAAAVYGNEKDVGNGLKAGGVGSTIPRSEVFVTSKAWNNSHSPKALEKAFDQSLADLNLDYLDLYLIHWPVAFAEGDGFFPKDEATGKIRLADIPLEETWAAMEGLVKSGRVKSIGVSNFRIEDLERILKVAEIPPAVNQIEAHPHLLQPELLNYHKEKGIVPVAYRPLGGEPKPGHVGILEDPVIVEQAKKAGIDKAQLIINYLQIKGFSVLAKSVTPARIESNAKEIDLSEETVAALDELASKTFVRQCDAMDWGVDLFHGK